MTLEELKAEAAKMGYNLQPSQKGFCRCCTGREWQLERHRKTCLKYEFYKYSKNGLTICKRIET